MAAENKTTEPEVIEIPFVSDDEIASGQEDRIKLFARIAAEKQAVPKEWLVAQLGIQEASLASLTSRYGYSQKAYKTKAGESIVKLTIKKPKKSNKKKDDPKVP